jgi:glycine betaine/proline transport system substrate-binding protein
MKKRGTALVLIGAIGVGGCSSSSGGGGPAPAADGGATASSTTVKLVQSPWDASRINVAIAKLLLTEQMGMTVQVTEIDEFQQWDPLASGAQDASLEVWPSGHAADIAKYIDTNQVENGGLLGPTGKISWYVPTYMLTTNPALATWEAYTVAANAQLFSTPETGDKGRFLNGDKSWTSYDSDIITNLKLDLQEVYAGSEDAELAELDSVYQKRGAILMYLWTPHAALAKYDLTPVQLPPYSDDCYAKSQSGGVACDYPADHLFKIMYPGLKVANPRAYQFLKNFAYTTRDQITLLSFVDNQKMSIDQAARSWVDQNPQVWHSWIPQ